MTDEMLRLVLETANAKSDGDGWTVLPEGRHVALHAAHHGVSMNVLKVEAVQRNGQYLRARTTKGEIVVLALEDIFAGSVDGAKDAGGGSRKTGFLG